MNGPYRLSGIAVIGPATTFRPRRPRLVAQDNDQAQADVATRRRRAATRPGHPPESDKSTVTTSRAGASAAIGARALDAAAREGLVDARLMHHQKPGATVK